MLLNGIKKEVIFVNKDNKVILYKTKKNLFM